MSHLQLTLFLPFLLAAFWQAVTAMGKSHCRSLALNLAAKSALEETVAKTHLSSPIKGSLKCGFFIRKKEGAREAVFLKELRTLGVGFSPPSGIDYE